VYGPVRTVVWQGSVGDRRPYADLTQLRSLIVRIATHTPTMLEFLVERRLTKLGKGESFRSKRTIPTRLAATKSGMSVPSRLLLFGSGRRNVTGGRWQQLMGWSAASVRSQLSIGGEQRRPFHGNTDHWH
jgi:hypothetical protein